jgi:hypothetical protein
VDGKPEWIERGSAGAEARAVENRPPGAEVLPDDQVLRAVERGRGPSTRHGRLHDGQGHRDLGRHGGGTHGGARAAGLGRRILVGATRGQQQAGEQPAQGGDEALLARISTG